MAGMPRGAARKAWGVLRTMLRKAFRWGVSSVDVTTRVMGPKRTDHQHACSTHGRSPHCCAASGDMSSRHGSSAVQRWGSA